MPFPSLPLIWATVNTSTPVYILGPLMQSVAKMKLPPLIHQFFDNYLPHIKGVSPYTIESYRDSFRLFLPFAAKYHGIKIRSLRLCHLSSELILAFLYELERERKNITKTRNNRLASIKSFAKMIRFMYPEGRELADRILNIPQKRTQRPLIGFLYEDEILQVFKSVDLRRKEGFRDYALLHLLFDSGARASEITTLNLDYFNPQHKTLAILGKGNRYRLIELKPYHICKKYLSKALPPKRLKFINPVHSFRHSCAVHMLYSGHSLSDIQNRLGHDNIQSTTLYLHLDLKRRRHIQKQLIEHMQSVIDRGKTRRIL